MLSTSKQRKLLFVKHVKLHNRRHFFKEPNAFKTKRFAEYFIRFIFFIDSILLFPADLYLCLCAEYRKMSKRIPNTLSFSFFEHLNINTYVY